MIVGYLLFFLHGLMMGITGIGSSLITVPILIYGFHISVDSVLLYIPFNTLIITLFALPFYHKKNFIKYKKGVYFSIPSIIGIFVTKIYFLHLIPNVIYGFQKDNFMLLILSFVITVSSISNLSNSTIKLRKKSTSNYKYLETIILSFLSGCIIGTVGMGAGFLIVASLMRIFKFSIKEAIGTSMVVVTLNSLMAIVMNISLSKYIDYRFLFCISLSSMFGFIIGSNFESRIDKKRSEKIIHTFLLLFSVFLFIKTIYFKSF